MLSLLKHLAWIVELVWQRQHARSFGKLSMRNGIDLQISQQPAHYSLFIYC